MCIIQAFSYSSIRQVYKIIMEETVSAEKICKNMNVCFHTGPVTLALTSSERASQPEVNSKPEAERELKPEAHFIRHALTESRSKRAAKENNVIRIMQIADIHVDPKYAVVSTSGFYTTHVHLLEMWGCRYFSVNCQIT